MELKQSTLCAILLAFPLLNSANEQAAQQTNEYHFDTDLAYAYSRFVDSNFIDTNNWGASLRYYWDPITYSKHYPNKEAVFINRLGSVGIGYRGAADDESDVDILFTGFDASIVYAAKDLNHVFGFDYAWFTASNFEIGGFEADIEGHRINFAYRYYLLDNLTLGAAFSANFVDDIFVDKEQYTYKVNSKYLWDIGNEHWLSLKAKYSYDDIKNDFIESSHNIAATIEYYFTRTTSLQVGGGASFLENHRGASYDAEFINVSVQHYFTDQFALNAGFQHQFFDNNDKQEYVVGIKYRF